MDQFIKINMDIAWIPFCILLVLPLWVLLLWMLCTYIEIDVIDEIEMDELNTADQYHDNRHMPKCYDNISKMV